MMADHIYREILKGWDIMLDRAGIRIEQGAVIGCERVEGVNDNMAKSHYHTHYELYFLEAGIRHHIMQDNQYETRAGDFMIFAPYVMHRSFSEKDVPFRRTVIYFTEDTVHAPELRSMLKDASGLYHASPKITRSILHILDALLQEQYSLGSLHNAAMENLLNSLLITIMQSVSVAPKPEYKNRMSKVIEYIETHYATDIQLRDIAAEFYLSEYYLCHEFKKYTNRTIIQYLNTTRILNAQRLIMETDLKFTVIARKTGFSSLTHFNRTFKSITGMSPSEFRKTLLPGTLLS